MNGLKPIQCLLDSNLNWPSKEPMVRQPELRKSKNAKLLSSLRVSLRPCRIHLCLKLGAAVRVGEKVTLEIVQGKGLQQSKLQRGAKNRQNKVDVTEGMVEVGILTPKKLSGLKG